MALPAPEPGLVIAYDYLWRHERDGGHAEGRKTRPCVVVLAVEEHNGRTLVTVAPVTHSPPAEKNEALLIPPRVKQHLGLDDAPSWVVLTEVNQFAWPGYDVRPVPGSKDRFSYGFLPPALYERIKSGILDLIIRHRASITGRD